MNFRFLFVMVFTAISTIVFAQKKATLEEQNANKIIGFGNTVIKLGNSYQKSIKYYDSVFNTADENINKIKSNPNLRLFNVNCNLISVPAGDQKAYADALRLVPTFPNKKDVQRYVDLGDANIKSIGVWCSAINGYFSNKQYEGDTDFSQYESMKDSLSFHLKEASTNWSKATKLAFEAGNEAEMLLLKKSPLAAFIIPMKEDITVLDQAFTKITAEDADLEALKNDLEALTQSITKNKDVSNKDVSKLRDIYYKEVYENFYRSMTSAVTKLNKLTEMMQDESTSGDRIQQWYSHASSDYSKVVENYNRFVGQ